jgi:hypothetical protein
VHIVKRRLIVLDVLENIHHHHHVVARCRAGLNVVFLICMEDPDIYIACKALLEGRHHVRRRLDKIESIQPWANAPRDRT